MLNKSVMPSREPYSQVLIVVHDRHATHAADHIITIWETAQAEVHLQLCKKLFALLYAQLLHICFPFLQERPFTVCAFAVSKLSQLVGM